MLEISEMLKHLEYMLKIQQFQANITTTPGKPGKCWKSRKSEKIQKIKEKLEIFLERARSFKKSKKYRKC